MDRQLPAGPTAVLLHRITEYEVIHLADTGAYLPEPWAGESKQPASPPVPAKGKHMSTHHDSPAPSRTKPVRVRTGHVREIYPGARTATPVQARKHKKGRSPEAGMATAEYAIATLAAVGFAGILVFIMRSDEVRGFLLNLIRTALALP